MDQLDGLQIELDEPVTEDSFKDFVAYRLQLAKESLLEGKLLPVLLIIRGDSLYAFQVPDGREIMAEFFVAAADAFKGADAYMLITESWSLSVPDMDTAINLMRDPTLLADNPFKEEHLSFEAHGLGQKYTGYVDIQRDDVGHILFGDTVYDEQQQGVVNIADLLLPMVE